MCGGSFVKRVVYLDLARIRSPSAVYGWGRKESILGFCVAVVVVCSFVLGFKIDFPFLRLFLFFPHQKVEHQTINP